MFAIELIHKTQWQPQKKHITTEAAAEFLHEVNRMYCKLIGDDSQVNWNNAPQWQKDSAINGVKAIISGKVQEAKDSHQLWFNEKKLARVEIW